MGNDNDVNYRFYYITTTNDSGLITNNYSTHLDTVKCILVIRQIVNNYNYKFSIAR